MVDRSYLPYKSAREYRDRGMAKWMGFFISEHSTALSKEAASSSLYEFSKPALENAKNESFRKKLRPI